jgi:predicted HNH restriction endonuclease
MKLRQKVLNRSNHVCEGCGDAKATQVHHMNYERWGGNELLIDLLAVCADCHRKLHPKDKDIVDVLIDSRNLPQNNRGAFFEMQLGDI